MLAVVLIPAFPGRVDRAHEVEVGRSHRTSMQTGDPSLRAARGVDVSDLARLAEEIARS
jgi:hypothetical protein